MAMPVQVMKTSLIGLPFVWATTVAAMGAVFLAWRARRGFRKAGAATLAAVLGLGAGAVWVNHHFAYVPNVGALMGRRAADQASLSEVAAVDGRATRNPGAVVMTHGLVEQVRIPAAVSGFSARSAQVYLPPAWFQSPRPALPVIELLHGTPGTPEDWTRAGRADVTADRWASAHGGVAPIIVMPDPNGAFTRDTECVDGRHGRAETYLTSDVPAWVIANLGASTDRQAWAIAGSSEGGFCALDLILHHRDRYATFLDFSGLDRPTYPGGAQRLFLGSTAALEDHTPSWYFDHLPPGPGIAGWFEVGSADGPNYRAVVKMSRAAQTAGFETHVVVVPRASHTWHLWVRALSDAFPWTASRLGLGAASTAPISPPRA